MPYSATVFRVMIASPIDVEQERAIARKVIHKWNDLHSEEKEIVLLPIGWETHSYPESGDRPQSILNKQLLTNADLLIGIFWTRIGTPTGKAEGGTAEEIDKHIEAGKPAMLYFSNKQIEPQKIDNEQYEKVKAFKKKYSGKSLYREFSTAEEFEKNLYDHLVLKVNDSAYFKRSSLSNKHDSTKSNDLDSEIPLRELLVMNILASNGERSKMEIQGYLNEKGLNNLDCGAAIDSLTKKGFIRQTNVSPISYDFGPKGYQWAMQNKNLFDQLNAEALSDEAKELLLEASNDQYGEILRIRSMDGTSMRVNNKNIIPSQDPRTVAKWEHALEELEDGGFIKEIGANGEVFKVTNKGYSYADKLKNSEKK